MKLSEILRTAADTELWDGIDGHAGFTHICIAAELAAAGETSASVKAATNYVEQHLQYPMATHNSKVFTGCLRRHFPEESFTTEEVQAMRFMFAHLLACAAEDEGN